MARHGRASELQTEVSESEYGIQGYSSSVREKMLPTFVSSEGVVYWLQRVHAHWFGGPRR